MGHNEREMRRLVRVMEAFLTAGAMATVRTTRRNLVKATPKHTQFAAQWPMGPPYVEQQDKPSRPLYNLPGDHETDAWMMANWELGDEAGMISPASYIVYLNAGTSPQADENFIPDAIDESIQEMRGWQWDGKVAA